MDRNMFKAEEGKGGVLSVVCMEKTLIRGMTGNTGGFSPPSPLSFNAYDLYICMYVCVKMCFMEHYSKKLYP